MSLINADLVSDCDACLYVNETIGASAIDLVDNVILFYPFGVDFRQLLFCGSISLQQTVSKIFDPEATITP